MHIEPYDLNFELRKAEFPTDRRWALESVQIDHLKVYQRE